MGLCPWTKLGPSRLGVLRTTAPDPNFVCSEAGFGGEETQRWHAALVLGVLCWRRVRHGEFMVGCGVYDDRQQDDDHYHPDEATE